MAIVGAVDALHRECSEKNNGKRKKNFSVLFIFFLGGGGEEKIRFNSRWISLKGSRFMY